MIDPGRARLFARLRRARARRGAAVFVVMLVMTLLMGLGMFAVRSASLSDMASGYHRQLTQTHYVADYAVAVISADMLRNAQMHALLMTDPSKMDTRCEAFDKLLRPTCKLYGYSYLEDKVVQGYEQSNTLIVANASGAPGSLGPVDLEADYRIELSDLHDAWPPLAGSQVSETEGSKPPGPVMITVSVEGQVRPKQIKAGKWDLTAATAAGVENVRAHLIVGPVKLQ